MIASKARTNVVDLYATSAAVMVGSHKSECTSCMLEALMSKCRARSHKTESQPLCAKTATTKPNNM